MATQQITVKKLIEILGALPQDHAVFVEGCDCVGECIGAETDECLGDVGGVLISRADGVQSWKSNKEAAEPK